MSPAAGGLSQQRGERLLRATVASCLFALTGLVQTLCFDERPSAWLQWFAWAPLVWLAVASPWPLRHRLLAAWISGTAFWFINVGWIAHTIAVHGGLPLVVALFLLLLLSLYMGLYWVAFVGLGAQLRRGRFRKRSGALLQAAGLAGLWVTLEIAREWVFTGFPWSPLGESLVRVPGALDAAAWVGVRGLSFLVLFINAIVLQWLLAEISASRTASIETGASERGQLWRPRLVLGLSGLLTVVLLAASSSSGAREGRSMAATGAGAEAPLPLRVVQPNVPIGGPADEVVANYQRLLRLSQCGETEELIVWPESAAYPYSWQAHLSLRQDVQRLLDDGCALLFNSAWQRENLDGSAGFTNTALLASPANLAGGQMALQSYNKMHLVPYGEYVPLKDVLPFVSQLARSVGEFEHGLEPSLLRWRQALFGVSICFEVLFPKEVAERVRLGATALMVLTNDAWFGDTRAPHQHLVSARFRAAENRRPLVFAAVTGASALIDSRGGIASSLPVSTAATLSADLVTDLGHRTHPEMTIYTRFGWAIDLGALLLFALAAAKSALQRRSTISRENP